MPIIEVNLESAIKRGLNIQLIGKADETLPEMFSEYYRLQKLPKSPPKKTDKIEEESNQTVKSKKVPVPTPKVAKPSTSPKGEKQAVSPKGVKPVTGQQ